MPRTVLLALCSLLALVPIRAGAQASASTDIITGVVTDSGGRPLPGATVEVTSLETEMTRSRQTGPSGRYTILFPDGGGQYRVHVRHLGMAPVTLTVAKQADEDRLVANVRMTAMATVLSEVVTTARARSRARPAAGAIEQSLSGTALQRLPVDVGDLNAVAALAPGAVSVAGSDSTPGGFSIAGQRPDQNQVTLDGLSFGGGGVPTEAIRTTRVITNTYDVSRGQFTGGQLAITTRGGTNVLTGSAAYNVHAPALELTGADSSRTGAFSGAYLRNQLSGGAGGPLIRDRAFWFGSFQLSRQRNTSQSLLAAAPATLQRLGVAPDSAQRFLALLGRYGIAPDNASLPLDRVVDNAVALARFDYHVSDSHSLTARVDWQATQNGFYRGQATGTPTLGGARATHATGAMLALASTLFEDIVNEARGSFTRVRLDADPYTAGPEGRVRVASQLSDGALGIRSLNFGANAALPIAALTSQLELTDELSFIRGRGHRWKLGVLVNRTSVNDESSANRNGTFVFNSLADFDANRPAQFTRGDLPAAPGVTALNSALYLGDSWRKSAALHFVYGARLEHSAYGGAPGFNPAVDSVFGLGTASFPTETWVSPRVGFTWIIGSRSRTSPTAIVDTTAGATEAEAPRAGRTARGSRTPRAVGAASVPGRSGTFGVLRGGFGEFRGRAPLTLLSAVARASGLPSAESQLVCVGSAVPVPDWAQYQRDPSAVPTQCAPGAGGSQAVSGRRPNVSAFDPAFRAPRLWRASLGFQRRLTPLYSASIDASYALGTSLDGVTDLNLLDTPRFALDDEGGRPVYVPASSIDSVSGTTSLRGSRRSGRFGHVYEVGSRLLSRSAQVTTTLNGVSFGDLAWTLSYSWQRARDQSSYSGGSTGGTFAAPTTAGNPNLLDWAPSALARTHHVQGIATFTATSWLDLSSIVDVVSGEPYTPLVGGDINGDGARNDRAFIFDPASTPDPGVAQAMARLLAGGQGDAVRCLRTQLGRVAGRNSCRSGWSSRVDLQANLRPTADQRLQLQLQLLNPLAGLDHLLHGADDLRGWGQPVRPDPELLFVRGFDPARRAYRYQVNERFGTTGATRSASFNPFQVALTGRLRIGADAARERVRAAARGGAAEPEHEDSLATSDTDLPVGAASRGLAVYGAVEGAGLGEGSAVLGAALAPLTRGAGWVLGVNALFNEFPPTGASPERIPRLGLVPYAGLQYRMRAGVVQGTAGYHASSDSVGALHGTSGAPGARSAVLGAQAGYWGGSAEHEALVSYAPRNAALWSRLRLTARPVATRPVYLGAEFLFQGTSAGGHRSQAGPVIAVHITPSLHVVVDGGVRRDETRGTTAGARSGYAGVSFVALTAF